MRKGLRRGIGVLVVLFVLYVLSVIGIALVNQAGGGHRQVRRQVLYNRAYYLAESGLQEAFDRLWRGQLPRTGQLTITDLDPPHRAVVRLLRSSSGSLNRIQSTGTVQDVSVTLTATMDFTALHLFTKGKP